MRCVYCGKECELKNLKKLCYCSFECENFYRTLKFNKKGHLYRTYKLLYNSHNHERRIDNNASRKKLIKFKLAKVEGPFLKLTETGVYYYERYLSQEE